MLKRTRSFLTDVRVELKKVSWPTRSEAINLTIIVVVVTTFLAIVLGLLDYIYSLGFGLLFQ
jgi:preprotein translocase subunit SecE